VLLIGAEVMIQVPTNVWRSPDGHSWGWTGSSAGAYTLWSA